MDYVNSSPKVTCFHLNLKH